MTIRELSAGREGLQIFFKAGCRSKYSGYYEVFVPSSDSKNHNFRVMQFFAARLAAENIFDLVKTNTGQYFGMSEYFFFYNTLVI